MVQGSVGSKMVQGAMQIVGEIFRRTDPILE